MPILRRSRTVQQRRAFWNDWGALVYVAFVGVLVLPASVFVPAESCGALFVALGAVLLPAIPVVVMSYWRNRRGQ